MTRKTKTVLFIGIILVFVCSLFGVLLNRNNTGGSAISQSKNGDDTKTKVLQAYKEFTKTKALQAYKEFLLQIKYVNEDSNIMMTHFAISDLDADGIPELLISEDFNILSLGEYYTFDNGTVTGIEGPTDDENYPVYGSLIPQPSRGTYVFFRGGPRAEEDGHDYMPYILIEYKLENHKIHMVNYADWQTTYNSGDKAGTTEYTLNGKKCSAEEIENQYQLDTENMIELLPNTDVNRKSLDSSLAVSQETR